MPEHVSVTMVLVEDDPGHARLIERNLRRAHITNDLVVFRDGQEAVEYFFPEGEDVAVVVGSHYQLPPPQTEEPVECP